MRILKLAKNSAIGSLLIAGMFACEGPVAYKAINNNVVNPKVKEKIDLIKTSSANIINNPEYSYFGKDTVKITSDIYKNYDDYVATINKIALEKNNFNCSELQTVINSDNVYTNSGLDIYIPVEYYGKEFEQLQ